MHLGWPGLATYDRAIGPIGQQPIGKRPLGVAHGESDTARRARRAGCGRGVRRAAIASRGSPGGAIERELAALMVGTLTLDHRRAYGGHRGGDSFGEGIVERITG